MRIDTIIFENLKSRALVFCIANDILNAGDNSSLVFFFAIIYPIKVCL